MKLLSVLVAVIGAGLKWGKGARGSQSCSGSAWAKLGEKVGGILRGPNYDKTRLPTSAGVNVSLSFLVQEISSISEIRSDFQLDVLYDELWTDPRLRFSSDGLCRNNFTLKAEYSSLLWRPDTCVVNSKAAEIHASPSNNSFVVLHDSGLLWASYRMKLEAPCRLDLTMFPFDAQTCMLQFESYSLSQEEVRLDWASSKPIGFLSQVVLPDFVLIGWRVRKIQLAYPNGLWDRLEAHFVFQRLYGYYFVQAYFPTLLTVLCSWLTFLLEQRSISARLSLSVSSLLALTFQLSTVTEELPRVSYLKCIDVWMFACILCIFSVNLEVAAVAFISRHERARQVGSLLILGWLERLRENHSRKLDPDNVGRNVRRRSAIAQSSLTLSSPPPDPAPESILGSLVASNEDPAPLFSRESWRFRWADCRETFRSFWEEFRTLAPVRWWRTLRRFRFSSEHVDKVSMVAFPLLFTAFNVTYWSYIIYYVSQDKSHQDLFFV